MKHTQKRSAMKTMKRLSRTEWLGYEHPMAMLSRLSRKKPRQLRLFACACARRAWHLLDERSREAVQIAERYADGRAAQDQVLAVTRAALGASGQALPPEWNTAAQMAAREAGYAAHSCAHVFSADVSSVRV